MFLFIILLIKNMCCYDLYYEKKHFQGLFINPKLDIEC